jgi:hypothetical protein
MNGVCVHSAALARGEAPLGAHAGEIARLRIFAPYLAQDDHPGRMAELCKCNSTGASANRILGEVPRLRIVARDGHPGRMVDFLNGENSSCWWRFAARIAYYHLVSKQFSYYRMVFERVDSNSNR